MAGADATSTDGPLSAAWRSLQHTSGRALDQLFTRVYCSRFGALFYLFTAPLAELHFYHLVRQVVGLNVWHQKLQDNHF